MLKFGVAIHIIMLLIINMVLNILIQIHHQVIHLNQITALGICSLKNLDLIVD